MDAVANLRLLTSLATAMLIWLMLMRSPRGATWWAIAVIFCTGLTAASKVLFYACPPLPDLRSPSGHASFSTLVYGAMTLAAADHTRGWQRMIAIGVGATFILAIAASRIALAHSMPEVGLGLTIGIAALILFGQSYWRHCEGKIWLSPLLAIGGVLFLILRGWELDSERLLHDLAGYFGISC